MFRAIPIKVFVLEVACQDCNNHLFKRVKFNDLLTEYECTNCGGTITHLHMDVVEEASE